MEKKQIKETVKSNELENKIKKAPDKAKTVREKIGKGTSKKKTSSSKKKIAPAQGKKEPTEQHNYMRPEEIAKIFGVSVRRVQQLTQEGAINSEKIEGEAGRKYDLIPTVSAYIAFLSSKAKGKEKNATEAALKTEKLKAEIALKESQGELHQLRTDIARGKYISIEEVKLDYQRFFVVLKKFVTSVPNRIAGMISGYVDPITARAIEKDMSNEANDMLNSFVLAGKKENEKNGEG